MEILLMLLTFVLLCAGIAVVVSIIQFIWPFLVCGGVIAGIVCGIVYLWDISSSVGDFFSALFLILGILLGSGVVMYIIYLVSTFFGALFGSDDSPSSSSGSKSSAIDTEKRHRKDSHETISRSCESCRFYDGGFGNCIYNTDKTVSRMDAKHYICDHFEYK